MHNFLIISNQALLSSLSKANQETSKNYLSGIMTSVFKDVIGSCAGRGGCDPCRFAGGCSGPNIYSS